MASLLLVRGLPGSGKSYISQAMCDTLGRDHTVIIDPDLLDTSNAEYQALCTQLRHEGVDEIYFPHRFLRAQAAQALNSGKTVIWNQAFTLEGGFIRTIDFLKDEVSAIRQPLTVLVVEVETDPAVALMRIKDRAASGGHDVPSERFEKFVADYTSFAHLGYPTVTVDGNQPIDVSLARIKERLAALSDSTPNA